MRAAVFLQARVESTRLPGKALLPLSGGTVLAHVMRALRQVPVDLHVLLTDSSGREVLGAVAWKEGFALHVGPTEDVLGRFCGAVQEHRVECVIRATGDNPLVSPRQARALLSLHLEGGYHLSHFLGPPLGTGVEIVQAEALLRAREASADPYDREHVTPYLYRHPELFRVAELDCPPAWRMPEARVTLDTPEDYRLIAGLFRELYRGRPVETEEILEWFRSRPEGPGTAGPPAAGSQAAGPPAAGPPAAGSRAPRGPKRRRRP